MQAVKLVMLFVLVLAVGCASYVQKFDDDGRLVETRSRIVGVGSISSAAGCEGASMDQCAERLELVSEGQSDNFTFGLSGLVEAAKSVFGSGSTSVYVNGERVAPAEGNDGTDGTRTRPAWGLDATQ